MQTEHTKGGMQAARGAGKIRRPHRKASIEAAIHTNRQSYRVA